LTAKDYFLGDSAAAGFTSILTFAPSGFLATGDATGFAGEAFGSTDGLAAGDASGLAVATGTGVETGLSGVVLVFGSHAPNTAVLTARIEANTNDLLIVFSSRSI
jgi:hypothetical protein